MTRVEKAESLHRSGCSCSQSVFGSFAADYGLDQKLANRLAAGLGAGLGRQQLVCGAVSGAALVLGLALGNEDGSQAEAKERCYAAVHAFVHQVRREKGSVECRSLLEGLDLTDPAQRATFKERSLSAKVCDPIIKRCVELLEERLRAEGRP